MTEQELRDLIRGIVAEILGQERPRKNALVLFSGALLGFEAALASLAQIAAFFRRTEPHSPVAYLLERAVTWANMPLEDWLAEVVRDQGTLSSIRERVGLAPSY